MAEYSKRDIAKKLGRSHRNITYWTDFGLVIPDIQPSQGRGIARIYSDRNLIEFSMIDIMVKVMKVSLDTIQYIFNNLDRITFRKIPANMVFSGGTGQHFLFLAFQADVLCPNFHIPRKG